MAYIEIDDEVDDSVEVSDDEIVEESSEKYLLHHGEALAWLRSLPDGYADALVTDPPAGIGFMGKHWILVRVPGPLREFVRKKFQKARSHPVMMDWDGNVIRPFKPQKDHANVYVIGRQGCVMLHLAGVSKSESLKELFATLDHAAPDPAVKIEQTR